MFGSLPRGASAYAQVGVETGVTAASPHKLIAMLFEAAMVAITSAIQHTQAGDISKKGQAISRAIAIVDNGLRASLDKKVGGEIALNLDALYAYMSDRLLQANLNNQVGLLEEVHKLLSDLYDAWQAIDLAKTAPQQPVEAPKAKMYDPLAPQPTRLVKA